MPTSRPVDALLARDQRRFLEAVQLGALGTVQRLASQVHDPMIPRNLRIVNPSDGWTTLMYAVLSGSFMMVRWILDQGHDTPDRPSCSYDRRTVLHLVAELGHEDILQLYLQRFPQLLEAKDRSGRTPLLVASRYGHEGLVEALLALDALVDAVDVEGNTALHYASAWGHLPIIRLLILHGCKYSMRNTAGWSASDWAFSPATRSVLEESAMEQVAAKKRSHTHRLPTCLPPSSSEDSVLSASSISSTSSPRASPHPGRELERDASSTSKKSHTSQTSIGSFASSVGSMISFPGNSPKFTNTERFP